MTRFINPLRTQTNAEVHQDLIEGGVISFDRNRDNNEVVNFSLLDPDEDFMTYSAYSVTVQQFREAVDEADRWMCCKDDIMKHGISYGCGSDWHAIKQIAAFGEVVFA